MKPREILASWPVQSIGACAIDFAEGISTYFYGDTANLFDLASISKPITATAVLTAAQEGVVDLEAILESGFSLADLMSHQSGLSFSVEGGVTLENCRISLENPNCGFFDKPPRNRRIYSNLGYESLALDLQNKCGLSFAQYLQEAVFTPIAMSNTYVDHRNFPDSGPFGAAAGIVSSATDMALFLTEWINGDLLDVTFKRRASTRTELSLGGILPGYGFFLDNTWGFGYEVRGLKSPHWTGSLNSSLTFGHFGQSGTFLWVDPQVQLACCVLTDRPFDSFAKENWPIFSDSLIRYRNL